ASRLERVGATGDPAPAPFVRTRLENGLTAIVRENRALPLVAVDCWLAVGALDESDEHAGVSHLLEHMFFKGTPRYPVGAMDRLVKQMGGYNNAATSMEYTHYYVVAPGEHFATALDLLADHLTEAALPADELERERQVVKEEIRRKDDAPHGRLYKALSTAAFGDSPYAREVLGTPESLDRIDVDVMREWWSSHYAPDRMVVTIAGDLDPAAAVDAVAARLGGLEPAGDRAAAPDPPPVGPATVEESMDVGQGYLAWAFPTAGRADLAETCALEVAATALGEGMTSRLHRRLIDETRLVTVVNAWTFGLSRVGLFGIDAVCAPERRGAVETEIAEILERSIGEGLTDAEVERARTMLVSDFAYDNETNAALAGTLGEFQTLYGDAGRWRDVLSGVAAVTPEAATEALGRIAPPSSAVRAWVGP
ncbi:MAG: pitrilysin family protein, partial [Gemmatimonadota bacterium]|nr:pitrilysin family protein [Gemmatimonadota bacterium]